MPHLVRPFASSGNHWRQRIKVGIGYTLATLAPRRVATIESGNFRGQLSSADRLIVAALVHRAQSRQQPLDHLAYLHQQMWNDDDAVSYHASVEDRLTTWFVPHESATIDALEADLAQQPAGRFHTLCEIGTGSGVILDYLAQRLSAKGISRFIGLDLSPAQIAINTKRFPKLEFIAADAQTWIPAHTKPGWIFFCCGGVLEYFPKPALARLLRDSCRTDGPIRWVIAEPVDPDADFSTTTDSHTFGSENTWSHNYPRLFTESGLNVLYQNDLRVDEWRLQLVVAGSATIPSPS